MSNKTVLITGSSSGIGRATAVYFQKQGWNVVATMRTPSKEKELTKLKNILCTELDVTRAETIQSAVKEALAKFGSLDAVVNNAGYGLLGPFESTTREQIERQFNTNVFGVMEVIREVLPHFRAQKNGVIVNVASVGGRMTFPLYSLYHATKFAIEGFSESLQYELLPFNIRIKIIEPGLVRTDFFDRSADRTTSADSDPYHQTLEKAKTYMDRQVTTAQGSLPEVIARRIYKAATDGSHQLRYAAGRDASVLLPLRKFTPDFMFNGMVRRMMLK